MAINEAIFSEPIATTLDKQRENARLKGKHLTYDCFNAKIDMIGDRVHCSLGVDLGGSQDGSVPLLSVIRGRTCSACVGCGGFNS